VKHFIKDMGIALQEAAAVGVSLPGLALVHQLYVAVMAKGTAIARPRPLLSFEVLERMK